MGWWGWAGAGWGWLQALGGMTIRVRGLRACSQSLSCPEELGHLERQRGGQERAWEEELIC